MKIPISNLSELLRKAPQVFVHVELNGDTSVYLRISKSTLYEYINTHKLEQFLIDYDIGDDNELLIG